MARKIKEILGEYSKFCPKCKVYQNGVFEECADCRTKLIDARKAYKKHRLRKFVKNMLLMAVLILVTYGIQKGERKYYNQSIWFFVTGKFHDARVEFCKAFSVNPIYKFVESGIESIKYKITHRTVVIELK